MFPALLQRFGRWTVAHPVGTDAVLAAGLTGVSVLQGTDKVLGVWPPLDGKAAVLTMLATLPTAFRRRAPTTVLVLCCAAWSWYGVLGYDPGANSYGIFLAMYTVATLQPWPRVLACATLCGAIWLAIGIAAGHATVLVLVAQGVVIPAVVWKVADSAKRLAIGNRKLADAGKALARQAAVDERLRIARELHDVVAHHMSVIAVQAGLARYVLRSDPDTANAALGTVLDTGAEALHELRRVLELLRLDAGESPAGHGSVGAGLTGGGGYEPAPGLAFLPELFNRMRAAGVPVEVTVTGSPHPLPSGVELCAYRIVQESLTNVLKHAAPATAQVRLHYDPSQLQVTVTDDGAAPGPATAPPGNGLIGMRERAMLYGGTLQAGPRAGGGYEVRLVLPVPELSA